MTGGQQENANTGRPRMALATEWWRRFSILCVLCLAAAMALPAQTSTTTFNTLRSFDNTDGAQPFAALV